MPMEKIKTIKNYIKSPSEWLKLKYSTNEETLRNILGFKQPKRTEIEVSFFQLCGLRCGFCWQDHDDPQGLETIVDKADTVISYIKNWKYLKDTIAVTMTGGELFQDNFDENFIDNYFLFMKKVSDEFKNKNIQFTLISNLNFNPETRSKVFNLLQKSKINGIDAKIGTSWDPTGRPLNDSFEKNLNFFKEFIIGVTLVLTKPSIHNLLRKENTYFEYIYKNFTIDFDYYVPTEYADKMMPSDWELLNVFRMFIKKYPKMPTIESWLMGDVNSISCGNLNKITILPDGSLVPCRQLDYSSDEFETPIHKESNSDIIEKYLNKYNCLSCEFFNKCTLSCFVMNDHKSYTGKEELDRCLYKILFEEINGLDN